MLKRHGRRILKSVPVSFALVILFSRTKMMFDLNSAVHILLILLLTVTVTNQYIDQVPVPDLSWENGSSCEKANIETLEFVQIIDFQVIQCQYAMHYALYNLKVDLQKIVDRLENCVAEEGGSMHTNLCIDSFISDQINRHGDRNSALPSYEGDPLKDVHIGPPGMGQLTKLGKQQSYNLGKYLRCRYEGFLNSKYYLDQIRAESSDVDRTIQTAQAILAGLLPPSNEDPESEWNPQIRDWQPIPVHTISSTLDNKIYVRLENCSGFQKAISVIMESPDYDDFKKKYKDLFDFIQEHTGIIFGPDVKSIISLAGIYDNWMVQQNHGFPLPSWTNKFPNFWKTLLKVVQHSFYTAYSTEGLRRFTGGPMLGQLLQRMQEKTKNSTVLPKMILYSGHDITLLPLLSVLGILDNDMEVPGYTAALVFELHRDLISPNEYTIKIFYRSHPDEPVHKISVRDCGSGNHCTLTKLANIKSKYYITDDEWSKQCLQSIPTID